jgi:multiple sugar transport system substrate-binding protein
MHQKPLNLHRPTDACPIFNRLTRRRMLWLGLSALTTACTVKAPIHTQTRPGPVSQGLTIWWTKGLLLAEDEAIRTIVQRWKAQTGVEVNLSFHKQDDILQKLARAAQAGNSPDILYAYKGDLALHPRLAWDGQLVDLSDVLEPVKANYASTALEAVSFYNQREQKRSNYAVPLSQEATYIFYWRDLLAQAGLGDRPLPQDWDGFWQVWMALHTALRPQKSTFYGLGLQLSPGNSDTYSFFEHVLQAYGVALLDRQGNLRVDSAEVQQGIQQALRWYTQFYQQGYVPPTATQWLTPDNNRALLNKQVGMTVNPSMSIPVSQRAHRDLYFQQLGTVDFPNRLDGAPMPHLVSINQAVILASSQNQSEAKDFLRYLIQPDVLKDFVQSAQGRFFPVMTAAAADPFWTQANDPHLPILAKTLRDRPTQLFYSVQNPAYSQVFQQHVWGTVLSQIATRSITVEQGASAAIQQIQEIFAAWQ